MTFDIEANARNATLTELAQVHINLAKLEGKVIRGDTLSAVLADIDHIIKQLRYISTYLVPSGE